MTLKSRVAHSERERNFAIRLMKHMVVPMFVLDSESRVIIWNKACERLTGVAAEDVVGTRDHWSAFYDEPRSCLADLVASGEVGAIGDLYSAHSDTSDTSFGLSAENWCAMPKIGSRLYLAIDAGPIFDEDGHLTAVVEILRDITSQKIAEITLQQLATIDGLTGISNRYQFNEVLEQEWNRARRSHEPIGLLLCDVDYFKSYNDTYGHQSGDDCLRAVATAIKMSLFRPGDTAARYGGEEFAVILPQSDLGSASNVAERIVQSVRALELPHSASEVSQHVTISIGVASITPTAENESIQLVKAADVALYCAKGDGRNRYKTSE